MRGLIILAGVVLGAATAQAQDVDSWFWNTVNHQHGLIQDAVAARPLEHAGATRHGAAHPGSQAAMVRWTDPHAPAH